MVKRFLRDNSLSLFFLALFLAALLGQAIAGHAKFNNEALAHGGESISLGRYLTSSEFGNAVMENWQSEYLQFMLLMLATIWLIQVGSPESKQPHERGRENKRQQRMERYAGPASPSWARSGGIRTGIYSNSLLIVMAIIFFGSWFAQSVTGWTAYNADQIDHGGEKLSWLQFLGTAEFWEATLQNWQSEFLAVGSFAVLAVYLRQRGSPESKPVGDPHGATADHG